MLDRIKKALKNHQPADLDQEANSAVLIPLFEGKGGAGLVFIHRASDTGPHSGQMGFPGGMVEPEDHGDLLRTALRESEEEIMLNPGDVEIIGELGQKRTILTELTVKPFVGVIPYPYDFVLDNMEVQGIYTAVLDDLIKNVLLKENPFDVPPPVYPVGGKPVWGLTARMLTELLEIIGEQVR